MSSAATPKRILAQVEFYLSDRNLAQDEFFREEIGKDGGWIPLSVLPNCNRIKAMGASVDDIKAALATSAALELSEDGTKVKRKAPFVPRAEKYGIAEDRCVLAVSNTPKAVRWVALKDAFEQVVNVAFVRLAETNAKAGAAKKRRTTDSGAEETKSDDVTAYVAVNCCGKAPADVLSELQAAHITMNGMEVKLALVEGDTLSSFWAEQENKESKPKKGDAAKASAAPKFADVKFKLGDKEYTGFDAVADRFHAIIKATSAGSALSGDALTDAKTVLCYHPSASEKLADATGITVGPHPTFGSTTCFMVTKADGSKVDFSWKKCVEAMATATAPSVDPATLKF